METCLGVAKESDDNHAIKYVHQLKPNKPHTHTSSFQPLISNQYSQLFFT